MEMEKIDSYITKLESYKNKILEVLKPVGLYARFSDEELKKHAERCFDLFNDEYTNIFINIHDDLESYQAKHLSELIYNLRKNNRTISQKRTTLTDKIKLLKNIFKNTLLRYVDDTISELNRKKHYQIDDLNFDEDELSLDDDDLERDLDLDLDADDDLNLDSEDDLDLDLDSELDDDDDLDLDDDEIDELRLENENLKDENVKIKAELQAYQQAWENRKLELYKVEEQLDEANKGLELAEKELNKWDEFHKNIYTPLRDDHLKTTRLLIDLQDKILKKNGLS